MSAASTLQSWMRCPEQLGIRTCGSAEDRAGKRYACNVQAIGAGKCVTTVSADRLTNILHRNAFTYSPWHRVSDPSGGAHSGCLTRQAYCFDKIVRQTLLAQTLPSLRLVFQNIQKAALTAEKDGCTLHMDTFHRADRLAIVIFSFPVLSSS